MKAFVPAVAAAPVRAVGAAVALDWRDLSTAHMEQSQANLRL